MLVQNLLTLSGVSLGAQGGCFAFESAEHTREHVTRLVLAVVALGVRFVEAVGVGEFFEKTVEFIDLLFGAAVVGEVE